LTSALTLLPMSTPTFVCPRLNEVPAPSGLPWISTSPALPLIFAPPFAPPSGSVSPSNLSAPTLPLTLPPIEIVMLSSALPKLSSVRDAVEVAEDRGRLGLHAADVGELAMLEQLDALFAGAAADQRLDGRRLHPIADLARLDVQFAGHVDELRHGLDRRAGLGLADLAGKSGEPRQDALGRGRLPIGDAGRRFERHALALVERLPVAGARHRPTLQASVRVM
jgi:hypothetical protein